MRKAVQALFETPPSSFRRTFEPIAIRGRRLSLIRVRYRDTDDADQPIAVGGPPPASPQTFDDDTASAAPADSNDWGSADDYATQSPYGFPYATTTYGAVVARAPGNGTTSGSPFPPMAMSSPLTPPGRPSLYPGGPWMTPPRMMTMARPAGSPMAGGAFRFH